jgi:hypothetical protein
MDYPEIFNYKVDREAPLPSGELVEKIAEEQLRKKLEKLTC